MGLKVIYILYNQKKNIVLSNNIFKAFINKDNAHIIKILKKVFYIYSKQTKKKKLYYFTKLNMITFLLKNKYKKSNKNSSFNKLYNDYISLSKKKDNMKINYFRNQSKLYPFSPRNNKRNLVTFSHSTIKKNLEPSNNTNFSKTYYFSESIPLNKKFRNIFNKNVKNGRNSSLDSEYYFLNNYSENDKSNDMLFKNYKNKMNNPIDLKHSFYKFPYQRNINSSRMNQDINKQMIEFIKDNKNDYLNKNINSIFNKNKKSLMSMNKEGKIDNLFNKSNRREMSLKKEADLLNLIYKGNSNSPIRFINNNKNNIKNRNKGNKEKKAYSSNKSLNPSSVGIDQTKTFYTNNNIKSNNTLKYNNSSSIPNTHYLLGLKVSSGFNECFYDINKENKIKNNKNELSMQSLSDSKMMELASKYITEEDNSSENYYMNNIIHNKKKYKNRKLY